MSYLNLPFVQVSDISINSLPKSENICDVCLDCLDLIFVIFKPPMSRSCAHWDCNPIGAFETFDISKEQAKHNLQAQHPDSGCFGMSGVVICLALSKGWHSDPEAFQVGHFLWPKLETAHEKSLAPRVTKLMSRADSCNTDVIFLTSWAFAPFPPP